MKNIHQIRTSTGNCYLYNLEKKRLFLISPNLAATINGELEGMDSSTIEYYKKKLLYLKKHKLQTKIFPKRQITSITPEMVESNLINTHQICFEVTDKCNLACVYCAYRDMYNDYDKRIGQNLDTKEAISILNKMNKLWISEKNTSYNKTVDIAFYGGEPTLNMEFVEAIINHIRSLKVTNRLFTFSMTTNGILLNRYMDFLAQNNVRLLISLDGDEVGNAYRVDYNGKSAFERIVSNVVLLRETYPKYFNDCVRFNAVLHDKNPLKNIYDYFSVMFHKAPRVNFLSSSGRSKEKESLFQSMSSNVKEELKNKKFGRKIAKWMGLEAPGYLDFIYFAYQSMGNVYDNYNDLISDRKQITYIPTGTCLPFSRKIFVTVNSKILPCERVGQNFVLGYLSNSLDYLGIANKYNTLLNSMTKLCKLCYGYEFCSTCLLNSNGKCKDFMDENSFLKWLQRNIETMENSPKDIFKVINKVKIV